MDGCVPVADCEKILLLLLRLVFGMQNCRRPLPFGEEEKQPEQARGSEKKILVSLVPAEAFRSLLLDGASACMRAVLPVRTFAALAETRAPMLSFSPAFLPLLFFSRPQRRGKTSRGQSFFLLLVTREKDIERDGDSLPLFSRFACSLPPSLYASRVSYVTGNLWQKGVQRCPCVYTYEFAYIREYVHEEARQQIRRLTVLLVSLVLFGRNIHSFFLLRFFIRFLETSPLCGSRTCPAGRRSLLFFVFFFFLSLFRKKISEESVVYRFCPSQLSRSVRHE